MSEIYARLFNRNIVSPPVNNNNLFIAPFGDNRSVINLRELSLPYENLIKFGTNFSGDGGFTFHFHNTTNPIPSSTYSTITGVDNFGIRFQSVSTNYQNTTDYVEYISDSLSIDEQTSYNFRADVHHDNGLQLLEIRFFIVDANNPSTVIANVLTPSINRISLGVIFNSGIYSSVRVRVRVRATATNSSSAVAYRIFNLYFTKDTNTANIFETNVYVSNGVNIFKNKSGFQRVFSFLETTEWELANDGGYGVSDSPSSAAGTFKDSAGVENGWQCIRPFNSDTSLRGDFLPRLTYTLRVLQNSYFFTQRRLYNSNQGVLQNNKLRSDGVTILTTTNSGTSFGTFSSSGTSGVHPELEGFIINNYNTFITHSPIGTTPNIIPTYRNNFFNNSGTGGLDSRTWIVVSLIGDNNTTYQAVVNNIFKNSNRVQLLYFPSNSGFQFSQLVGQISNNLFINITTVNLGIESPPTNNIPNIKCRVNNYFENITDLRIYPRVENNSHSNYINTTLTGGVNINEPPLFNNPDNNDFTLNQNSPHFRNGLNFANIANARLGFPVYNNNPLNDIAAQANVDVNPENSSLFNTVDFVFDENQQTYILPNNDFTINETNWYFLDRRSSVSINDKVSFRLNTFYLVGLEDLNPNMTSVSISDPLDPVTTYQFVPDSVNYNACTDEGLKTGRVGAYVRFLFEDNTISPDWLFVELAGGGFVLENKGVTIKSIDSTNPDSCISQWSRILSNDPQESVSTEGFFPLWRLNKKIKAVKYKLFYPNLNLTTLPIHNFKGIGAIAKQFSVSNIVVRNVTNGIPTPPTLPPTVTSTATGVLGSVQIAGADTFTLKAPFEKDFSLPIGSYNSSTAIPFGFNEDINVSFSYNYPTAPSKRFVFNDYQIPKTPNNITGLY